MLYNNMRDAAVQIASKGYKVLPVSAETKAPIGKNWPTEATSDLTKIISIWQQKPNAMVGIATGRASGIYIVDCDEGVDKKGNAKNGIANFENLMREQKIDVSQTYQVESPSGGRHYYFSITSDTELKNSASKLASFVDTRGDGGMIVAAGSIRSDGRAYKALNDNAPMLMPSGLLSLLQQHFERAKANEFRGIWNKEIPNGRRNSTLLSIAGSLKRYGVEEAVINATLQAINEAYCRPPMDSVEVSSIACSITNYKQTYTDTVTGNAQRFTDQNKGKVLYCPETDKWYIWDSKKWCVDKVLYVHELAKEVAYNLMIEAEAMSQEKGGTNV